MPTSLPAQVLDRLGDAGARPRLTWYDDEGRVELSGHVAANWVVKTTNLLCEELDVEPGVRVVLDLPPHWRTVVWGLAAWRAGASVVIASDRDVLAARPLGPGDVVVTDRPGAWPTTQAHLVVVTLAALARRFPGELPAGAVDAASAVMTYPDRLGLVPDIEPGEPALEADEQAPVPHHDLAASLRGTVTTPAVGPGERVLVTAGPATTGTLLATAVLAWSEDASLVVAPQALPQDRLDRIATDEQVTERRDRPVVP